MFHSQKKSPVILFFRNEHGTVFKSGAIAKIIYQASGSSVDWAHTKLGVKYSYALELRDRGRFGFMLPVNEIGKSNFSFKISPLEGDHLKVS